MNLTVNNFCKNIKNVSDAMRTVYVCKKTGKVCPKVDYSSGKALPSKYFVKSGCALNIEEEIVAQEVNTEIVEEVVEVEEKNNTIDTMEEIVAEAIEEMQEIKVEEITDEVVEVKPEFVKTQNNNYTRKKKQNNKKK